MAEGKKVKYEDLFDDNLKKELEELVKVFQMLRDSVKVTMTDIGKGMKNNPMKSPEDMEKLANAIKKVNEGEKSLKVLTDEQVKAEMKLKEAHKDRMANLKAEVQMETARKGSVEQLRAELAKVTLQWKALSAEERDNSEKGKSLIKAKKDLTDQLKTLEQATGDYRRNVGNYTESMVQALEKTGLFGKSLSTVTNIYNTTNTVVNEVTKVFNSFTSEVKNFMNVSQETNVVMNETNNTLINNTVIHEEATVATEANTVATEANTVASEANAVATGNMSKAWKILNNVMKASIIGAIVAVLGSLVAYVKTTEEGIVKFEATMASLGGIIQLLIGRIGQLGAGFVGIGVAIKNVFSLDFEGASQAWTEATKQMSTAFDGLGDAVSKMIDLESELVKMRRDNRRENLKDLEIIRIQASEVEVLNQIADDQTVSFRKRSQAVAEASKKMADSNEAEIRMAQRAVNEKQKELDIRKMQNEDTLTAEEELSDALDKLDDAETKRTIMRLQNGQRARQILIKEVTNNIAIAEEMFGREKLIRQNEIDDIEKGFKRRKAVIDSLDTLSKDKFNREIGLIENAVKKTIDYNDLLATEDEAEFQRKIRALDLGDKAEDLLVKALKLRKAEVKEIGQIDAKLNKEIANDLKRQLELSQQFADEVSKGKVEQLGRDIGQAQEAINTAIRKGEQVNFDQIRNLYDQQSQIKKDQLISDAEFKINTIDKDLTKSEEVRNAEIKLAREKLNNDLKALDAEQLKNSENIAKQEKELHDKRVQEMFDNLNKVNDAIAQGLAERAQKQQDADQKEIDMRKKNSDRQLQLAMAGKENALAQEEAQLAKAEKRKMEDAKKAQKQQEAIELAKVFLNLMAEYSKSEPNGATAKALAMTLVAKGISKAIAGAFADGVENLAGAGTETSDSNLALLSKGESVVTAKGTRDNPGLATAMNKGMVDEYFQQVYLPQFATSNHLDVPKKDQVNNAIFNVLNHKLSALESAIKDKPVSMTKLDGLGEWTEQIQKGNMKIINHYKRKGNRF